MDNTSTFIPPEMDRRNWIPLKTMKIPVFYHKVSDYSYVHIHI